MNINKYFGSVYIGAGLGAAFATLVLLLYIKPTVENIYLFEDLSIVYILYSVVAILSGVTIYSIDKLKRIVGDLK